MSVSDELRCKGCLPSSGVIFPLPLNCDAEHSSCFRCNEKENFCPGWNTKDYQCIDCSVPPRGRPDEKDYLSANGNEVNDTKAKRLETIVFNQDNMKKLRDDIRKSRKFRDEQIVKLNESTKLFEESIRKKRDELEHVLRKFYRAKEERMIEMMKSCLYLESTLKQDKDASSICQAKSSGETEKYFDEHGEEKIERQTLHFVFSRSPYSIKKELQELHEQITKPEAIFKVTPFLDRPDFGTILYIQSDIPNEGRKFNIDGKVLTVKSYGAGIYVVSRSEEGITLNNLVTSEKIYLDMEEEDMDIQDLCLGGDNFIYYLSHSKDSFDSDFDSFDDDTLEIGYPKIICTERDLSDKMYVIDYSTSYLITQPTEETLQSRITLKFFNYFIVYDRNKHILCCQPFKRKIVDYKVFNSYIYYLFKHRVIKMYDCRTGISTFCTIIPETGRFSLKKDIVEPLRKGAIFLNDKKYVYIYDLRRNLFIRYPQNRIFRNGILVAYRLTATDSTFVIYDEDKPTEIITQTYRM